MVEFEGIEEVTVYFYGIIRAIESEREHRKVLDIIVERVNKWGVKFNKEKMQFMTNSVISKYAIYRRRCITTSVTDKGCN